jgi:hypothetical protein
VCFLPSSLKAAYAFKQHYGNASELLEAAMLVLLREWNYVEARYIGSGNTIHVSSSMEIGFCI